MLKNGKNTFESSAFQKSWAVHTEFFGPILEPAFADNYRAKVDLTAALNLISDRKVKAGIQKLEHIKKHCITDADKAAWFFCMGLAFEIAGNIEGMVDSYTQACTFCNSFYFPYLKIAKAAHQDAVFAVSEKNYRHAIRCLENGPADEKNRQILASVYANLASCLTMMRRYEDAVTAITASKRTLSVFPQRAASEAVLYAAMEQPKSVSACLSLLQEQAPALFESTKQMTEKVLSGSHPQFSPIKCDPTQIDVFWRWFLENESLFYRQLTAEAYDSFFTLLDLHLSPVFPYMNRTLKFGVTPMQDRFKIEMADFFAVALQCGYEELLAARPKMLEEHWQFEITR